MIHVNSPNFEIVTADDSPVPFQITPIVNNDLSTGTDKYRVYFKVSMDPVTVSTLFVRRTGSIKAGTVPSITVLRTKWPKSFLKTDISTDAEGMLIISIKYSVQH